MKVYFAGAENTSHLEVLTSQGVKNFLFSYYYLRESDVKIIGYLNRKLDWKEMSIFLDCGAYTAWSQNTTINLQQYIEFIKHNEEYLTAYSALDDKNSVENTKANLKAMEDAGLKPVPVYHMTMKDWDYLEELCKTHDYVALGAIAGEGGDRGELERNLRRAVDIATKYKTRFHAYGVTIYDILAKTAIYSCDLTSWLVGGKNGQLLLPDHSKRSIGTFHHTDKELFKHEDFFQKYGLSYEVISKRENWKERDIVNIHTFLEINEELNKLYKENGMVYWDEKSTEASGISTEEPKDNLPKETRGKIQEILKENPEAREKRLAALRGNIFGFKTGKYMTGKVPLYCNNCYAKAKCDFYQAPEFEGQKIMCALIDDFSKWFAPEDFDIRDETTVNELKNRIIGYLLQKLSLQRWFEMLDGGIQDKAATALAGIILDKITAKTPLFQMNNQININKSFADTVNTLDEEDRIKIITILDQAIESRNVKSQLTGNEVVDRP